MNPKAPVYIVSGACGSGDGHEPYLNIPSQTWNVMYDNSHYGIAAMKVNQTSLEWSFLDSATGSIIDHFFIIKDKKL